jgi:hypothetical protein
MNVVNVTGTVDEVVTKDETTSTMSSSGGGMPMWAFAMMATGFLLTMMLAAYVSLRGARQRKIAMEERERRAAREALMEMFEAKEATHAAWAGRCSGIEMPDGKVCVGIVVVEDEDEEEEEEEEDATACVEVCVEKA